MNQGRYVFSQLTDFIPRYELEKCVKKYKGDYKVKSFSCWDQFLAMGFGQITFRSSLRSIITCLNAHRGKLYHVGFRSTVARKTLTDANESRDWRIYADFAQVLISEARRLYVGDHPFVTELNSTVYALDSTTIDLCITVFKWAKFRKTKAAIKLHTLLDIQGGIPVFIHITEGKYHDVNVLDILKVEAGAYYIMDRGYTDFSRLHGMHLSLAFFITRMKTNTAYKRLYSQEISRKDKEKGVRCDQVIRFTGPLSAKKYPDKLRRIKYYDKEQDKYYEFLTNNFSLEAGQVADLYRERWKVELFFKWIKQHLKIKVFWGHSFNAVKTQIWISVCIYLIIAIMKKKLKLEQSMNEILQILSVSPFDKDPLFKLFSDQQLQNLEGDLQESLF